MSEDQVKSIIKCIHRIWYASDPNWLESKAMALELHQHLGELFNYAEITETLCKNNPDRICPSEWADL